jgi:hypothetical protein
VTRGFAAAPLQPSTYLMSNNRPQALPVQSENIPPEIKSAIQWCTWKYVSKDDKWTKVPLQVDGAGAKSNDPETWTDFDTVLSAYSNSKNRLDGICFMFAPPVVGVDLDKCRDPKTGEIQPWAQEIISSLNSYTEISPSGTGIHIFAIGSLPKGGRKKGPFEIYNSGRCFTVTGARFDGTPATVETRESEIRELHFKIFGNGAGNRKASASDNKESNKTLRPADKKLLAKIFKSKNGKKISQLYDGKVDEKKYPSASEADLALCSVFTAFTQDADRIDRLFRSSKLFRPKWDKKDGDGTYGSRTITKVLESEKPVNTGAYSIQGGRFCRDRQTKEGRITEPLCNFFCMATEQELRDDGLNEPTRNYMIEGSLDDGTSLPAACVAASKFPRMNWTEECWGMRCVIRAGNGTKDYLREAIKLFSANVRLRRIYTHTGWRKLDGQWVYLGGSTTGETDYEIDLGPDLSRYRLPAVADDSIGAMRLSLKLLDLAPLRITAPLFSAIFRASLSSSLPMDTTIWLEGKTGSLKSTLAALFLCHFGEFGRLTLPAAWASTANVLEKRSFILKDSCCCIDEYVPGIDAREFEVKANRMIRAQGNQAGRSRLRSDLSERATFIPRGVLISTGEQHPPGASFLARCLIIEIGREEIDLAKLTEAQSNAGRLPHAMRGYVDWLAPQMDTMRETLSQGFTEARKRMTKADRHLRIAEAGSHLYLGLDAALQYAEAIGAIGSAETEDLRNRCEQAFRDLGEAQAIIVEDEKPSKKFFEILRTMLDQGRAALLPTVKDYSDEPQKIFGAVIGWTDEEFYFLLPQAAFQSASKFCRDTNERFPVSLDRLKRDLLKEGISEVDPGRFTKVVKIEGLPKRVLKVSVEKIQQLLELDNDDSGNGAAIASDSSRNGEANDV